MRDMDRDVAALVDWFLQHIGRDWAAATTPRTAAQTRIGITRGVAPWDEVHRVMTQQGADSVPSFVAAHARNLTGTFYTFAP